ncbi:subtilisin-like protease SBT1.3 [Arachis stenosperma]|uniref:subtilisin-like protease SBT1.3 n=1 Tax=Arachis stenosperma TaxID=217475 RepID=UPI0025ABF9C9|nr:subtilisin-like protease SBT1.3 [Arachis stenosperma]
MANKLTMVGYYIILITNCVLLSTVCLSSSANAKFAKKTYIIQMDKSAKPNTFSNHLEWYSSKVKSVLSKSADEIRNEEEERIIYTYETAFHGVAAKLTEEEAEKLESEEGVVAIFPETKYTLHTTRSPGFLGLEPLDSTDKIWSENVADHDVIVGVLDTGIWPESESFNDTGMKPVPSHWRGACEIGRGFRKSNCNKKIVGARIFYRGYESATGRMDEKAEYKSPRDQDGHGTHTAATVAGSPVRGANLLGYAYGTARGMAPSARIAAYKVCWTGGCFSSDILSAVDRAVADGVNVLSISLGGGVSSYDRDSLSVAAFGAMEHGVFVSCSAGNAGPDPVSLTNVSPWITTVGASTMDRDFPAEVRLGNGKTIAGSSLYKGTSVLSLKKQYPLVYLGGNSSSLDPRSLCLEGTLDPKIVKGKIVICDRGISARVQKGQVVASAGGVGMILTNTATNGEELVADCHLLPAVAIGETEGKELKRYVLTKKNGKATATLAFMNTRLGIRPSPVVAAFSSRGPNFLTLEILKPDLVAPGVNILAAWSGLIGPSSLQTDHRRVKFNILSGTSMSCPHVSGVAAFIKSKHPQWSPAAIKSALMTTAYVHDNTIKPLKDASSAVPSTPYDHGAGHINPRKALDPGLVYDISPQDYFEFLCTQKLTLPQLRVFGKYSNRTCKHYLSTAADLNYPAISVLFPEKASVSSLTVHRTVTNVGPAVSKYHVMVSPFIGASVKVEPDVLNFTTKYQKLSYKVTFTTRSRPKEPEFGGLVWKDGVHRVRSPIVITYMPPI